MHTDVPFSDVALTLQNSHSLTHSLSPSLSPTQLVPIHTIRAALLAAGTSELVRTVRKFRLHSRPELVWVSQQLTLEKMTSHVRLCSAEPKKGGSNLEYELAFGI